MAALLKLLIFLSTIACIKSKLNLKVKLLFVRKVRFSILSIESYRNAKIFLLSDI